MTSDLNLDTPVSTPAPAPTRRLPLVVWVLGAVTFLVGTTEMMIAGILPEMSAALQVSEAQTGMLITVFALGMMIGAPVMALATLRLPHRTVLVGALLLFAVGHVLGAATTDFGVAVVGRLLSALGTGTFWAVGALVATSVVGYARAAQAMGVMIGGLTVANVVGIPLGAAVGQTMAWQSPFWVLAAAALVAAVVMVRLVPGHSRSASASVRGELRTLATSGCGSSTWAWP